MAIMTTAAGVHEGDVIAQKYAVERVLGAGGMGVVVAARHLKLDERVAIKFIHPDALGNAEAVARFEREARTAVRIKSEHVARVIDVGTLETGAPYMVMEYLEGEDLAAWLSHRGPLSVVQGVDFLLQAMEAIAEAHVLGIVHRDLKPANFFCVRRVDGLLSIKVLDFGISKFVGNSLTDMSMTTTAAVMGSPLYMSPEQMRSSRDVDATADIWALGVILFQFLTGSTPFDAHSVPELAVQIATTAPRSLSSFFASAPRPLERVIQRCLQPDRTQRYPDLAELAAALVEFGSPTGRVSAERIARTIGAAKAGSLAPPSFDGSEVRTAAAPKFPFETTPDSWSSTRRGSSGKRTWFVISSAVLGMSLAFAFLLWKMSAPSAATPSETATSVVRSSEPAEKPKAETASVPEIPPLPAKAEARIGDRLPAWSDESSAPAKPQEANALVAPHRREAAPASHAGKENKEKVTIEITNARPGLTVKVDGRPASLPLRLRRDGKTHDVEFETPNFHAETRRVRADASSSITLENKPGYYVP
jgi:serine/threonine-protein kinase